MIEAAAQVGHDKSQRLIDRGDGTVVPVGEVVHSVLADVSDSAVQDFVRIAQGSRTLDPELWGNKVTLAQAHESALASLAVEFEMRRDLLRSSITSSEAAALLGVSEQAILDRLRGRSLVGLKQGRTWRLPTWQFHAGTQNGYVPGLKQLQDAHPGSLIALSRWVNRPHPGLHGRTPVEELVDGNAEAVLTTARRSTAAAW